MEDKQRAKEKLITEQRVTTKRKDKEVSPTKKAKRQKVDCNIKVIFDEQV